MQWIAPAEKDAATATLERAATPSLEGRLGSAEERGRVVSQDVRDSQVWKRLEASVCRQEEVGSEGECRCQVDGVGSSVLR